ncbi:MAG TPA: hypothetical protein DCQ64_29590 [Candidatus Rokubacteria bacterium]|nr:hypothetical protein [Candidatus Rokubacteria bacterium]
MYRAKFRVLEKVEKVTYPHVDGRTVPTPRVLVKFWPVTAKNQWSSSGDESEENRSFWEATPSGEAELLVTPEDASNYRIGQTFFVEFRRDPAGTWKLGVVTLFTGAIEIGIYPDGDTGKLKMNVQRAGTVRSLLEDVTRPMDEALVALIAQGKANGYDLPAPRWSVTFTSAPE